MAHAPTYYAGLVQATIERILRRPSVSDSLEQLASDVGIAPTHLAWVFWGMVGEPLPAFVRRISLERAVGDLVRTDRPLADIARDVGYDDLDGFEAAFKAAFATTPRLFRRLRTPRFRLPAYCGIHYADSAEPPLFLPVDSKGRYLAVATRQQPALRVALLPAQRSRFATLRDLHVRRRTGRYLLPQVDGEGNAWWRGAIVVDDGAERPDGGEVVTVAGGRVALTTVEGSENTDSAWLRFAGEWLPSTEARLRPEPFLERLLDDRPGLDGHPVRAELLLPLV